MPRLFSHPCNPRLVIGTSRRANGLRAAALALTMSAFAACSQFTPSTPTAAGVQAQLRERLAEQGVREVKVEPAGTDRFSGTVTNDDGSVLALTVTVKDGVVSYTAEATKAELTTRSTAPGSADRSTLSSSHSVITGSFHYSD